MSIGILCFRELLRKHSGMGAVKQHPLDPFGLTDGPATGELIFQQFDPLLSEALPVPGKQDPSCGKILFIQRRNIDRQFSLRTAQAETGEKAGRQIG